MDVNHLQIALTTLIFAFSPGLPPSIAENFRHETLATYGHYVSHLTNVADVTRHHRLRLVG